MAELYRLCEQHSASSSSLPVNNLLINKVNENDPQQHALVNTFRRRHTTNNHLNKSYDLLEQDLAHLRESIDEISALVERQKKMLSKTEHFKSMSRYHIRNASSLFQKAVHNRYVAIASGAVLGATIGGPVGFMMGMKVGAVVALSGSAVGALSLNSMQQRVSETDQSQNNTTAYNQAML